MKVLGTRQSALDILRITQAPAKAAAALALAASLAVDSQADIAEPPGVPGRPERPRLVSHTSLKLPSLRTPAGIAALAGWAGVPAAEVESDVAGRAAYLGGLVRQGVGTPAEVRPAILAYQPGKGAGRAAP